jgi:hypothetical protein
MGLLPLMEGQENALAARSHGLKVLPLDQQSLEVRRQVAYHPSFGQ